MSEPLIDGDFNRAIREHSKAIVLNPDDAEAYCSRGVAYESKGDLDRANEDFKKARELDVGFGKD